MRLRLPVLLLVLAVIGCQSDEDRVHARVAEISAALQYKDPLSVYAMHVESRDQGVLCAERFAPLFEKTRSAATTQGCFEARAALADEGIAEDVRLLSSLVEFHCRQPQGTCRGFAREHFVAQLEGSRFVTAASLSVAKVSVERDDARAYVDLVEKDGQSRKVTLHLRRIDDTWYLVTYPW